MRKLTLCSLVLAVLLSTAPMVAQEAPTTEDELIELVRSDIQKDKVAIIGSAMDFSSDEAGKFWPIYKEYESALAAVGDQRVALIKDYAANFTSMTDEKAGQLAQQAMELEQKRFELKKQCFEKLSEGVSPVVAARFLQVENQLNLLLDLQVAQQVPLIEKP
jgi:hypothetical protein